VFVFLTSPHGVRSQESKNEDTVDQDIGVAIVFDKEDEDDEVTERFECKALCCSSLLCDHPHP
jgi:hypothetical protein